MAMQAEPRAKFSDQLNIFAEVKRFVKTAASEEFIAGAKQANAASHAKSRLRKPKAEVEAEINRAHQKSGIARDKPRARDGKRNFAVATGNALEEIGVGRVVGIQKNEQFARRAAGGEVALLRRASRTGKQCHAGEIAGDLGGLVIRIAIAHDDFTGSERLGAKVLQQDGQTLRFVERGNDDGNRKHGRSVARLKLSLQFQRRRENKYKNRSGPCQLMSQFGKICRASQEEFGL